ncbi:MAG: ATP-binding protein [Planctomycetota bacterium]|jgi:signal transduction histidine kinase
MPPIEIDIPLDLTDRQVAMCEMHSFNNIMNVVIMELQVLNRVFDEPDLFLDELATCHELLESFNDRDKARQAVGRLEHLSGDLRKTFLDACQTCTWKEEHNAIVDHATRNLNTILAVVEVRIHEVLARLHAPGRWAPFNCQLLQQQLFHVLLATALNSKGRFQVECCCTADVLDESTYGFDLRIEGNALGEITIPEVLRDVLRDLTANARKYSDPGRMIHVTLRDLGDEIVLAVSDEGRGIPSEEIVEVVRYGVRGSNTLLDETQGGGFGLTKAYLVTRQHGGRMWLESAVGAGTRITIRIPKPSSEPCPTGLSASAED